MMTVSSRNFNQYFYIKSKGSILFYLDVPGSDTKIFEITLIGTSTKNSMSQVAGTN